jgi:hypothetical protein
MLRKFFLVSGKLLLLYIVLMLIFFSVIRIVTGKWLLQKNSEPKIIVKYENENYEIALVKADLETYGYISNHVENLIIKSILDAHKHYNIPIGLLHCIFRVESDYKFNIDHPTVTVSVHGKRITTHAIGLGGVMWCFWGDSLKAHGIAQMETDLYLPDINIRASAYILSVYIKGELKNSNQYNILDNIISKYYGAYNNLYMSKMEKITSDLWMKRMSKAILIDRSK